MPNVLEEITEIKITPQYVTQRVDDWLRRIDSLYTQIESWLPKRYLARRSRMVLMQEEMMHRFKIPPRQLPVLEISRCESQVARIEPRALWVIGANGRLDMFTSKGQYVIVDDADNFDQPSWILAPFSNRRDRRPLTRETIASLLFEP